ncbi:ABC transporter ATP-binding protein [Spirochaeta dissipatitropha]
MIELKNVSKVYKTGTFGGKKLLAVRDVSFTVKDGEAVSLIGESGSGKSTIGKMILGLIRISEGEITANGVPVKSLKNRRQRKNYYRKVQGVFQDPFSTFNPIFKADKVFYTIHDEFFPEVAMKDWKARINEALEAVGLNPVQVLDKYPHQLSGGQLQRFLIARALLLDINCLVADEVISMLDASTRIDVLNLLGEIKKRGLSVLFVTHDLSLGYYISEKTVILYRGRVVEIGDTKRIFDNTLHPYTKMLMESVPRLDKQWDEEETVISSSVRTQNETGCVYHHRCRFADEKLGCMHQQPPLYRVEDEHEVACFLYREGSVKEE